MKLASRRVVARKNPIDLPRELRKPPPMRMHRPTARLLAAALSGVLIALIFPPYNLTALVWVALIPLTLALWSTAQKRRVLRGLGLGWLTGAVAYGMQFCWIGEVSWLGAVLLPAYLALYTAAFGAFASTLGRPRNGNVGESLRVAFCLAGVWAGLEWLRSWLLTGFGWNPLGVAFHNSLALSQAADILGVCGLSMLPVFLQTVLVQAGQRMLEGARTGRKKSRNDFLVAVGTVACALIYGIIRIATLSCGPTTPLRALLVQLNIPQEAARQLWTSTEVHMGYEEETQKALQSIADQATTQAQQNLENSTETNVSIPSPDWVIWPEASLTGRVLTTASGAWGMWQENLDTIEQVRRFGTFELIFGINELEAEDAPGGQLAIKENPRAWNSIAALSPTGDLQTYRKHHLVIFGETIPLIDKLPFLQKIYEQQAGVEYTGSFDEGTGYKPLTIPTADGTLISAIPSICFEDTVPRLTRKFSRRDLPQVILNVTNDGWFKESAAAQQHFLNAKFRAIELRRPMLRCANTGVSAAIDQLGSTASPTTGKAQILTNANGSHFTRGSLLAQLNVPTNPATSLYTIIGDAGIISVALLALVTAIFSRRAGKRDL